MKTHPHTQSPQGLTCKKPSHIIEISKQSPLHYIYIDEKRVVGNVVKADAKPYSPYVLSLSLALRYLINPSFTLLQFILHWEFERVQARNLLSKPLKRS